MTNNPSPSNLISSSTGDWEMVIGLEVHAQVTSKAKLFSGAATKFGAEPNSQVSLVDAAMPGMLPVINEECVAQAVRTGLGLKAKIKLRSVFDRKNYFYPDLPQGYQISQFTQPVVGEGEVVLDMADGESVHIGIERLHLEQDAGKSLHDQDPKNSYVDLNRSGVALMEIVSKPDIRSSAQAQAYVTKLRAILRYLGTCNGDMEEGSLRADVNVSVRRPGEPLGTRCEIKNMNSIRFIGQVDDPKFTLNASLSAVVQDKRQAAALKVAQTQAEALVRKMILLQARTMPVIGKMLKREPSLLKIWLRRCREQSGASQHSIRINALLA